MLDRSYAAMITTGIFVAFAAMMVLVGLWFFQESTVAGIQEDRDGNLRPVVTNLGPSGLPIPRFVSLRQDKVNVRRGPSTSHKVSWVFTRKGYPIEIVAESDHWRRIRDAEGEEGWVYHSLLSGGRTGVVSPWRSDAEENLLGEPSATSSTVAVLEAGVLGRIERCTGQWCNITVGNYSGWIRQNKLWGVYPGEQIE